MMENILKQLAEARQDEAIMTKERKSILEAVTETPEYKNALAAEKQRSEIVATLEAELRRVAIARYSETDEKKFPGVSIRIMQKIRYDAEQALAWCQQNLKSAVKLDATKFEKAAKAADLDTLKFVERYEEASAAIDSDLSQFLT
jgi:hypothetical protein